MNSSNSYKRFANLTLIAAILVIVVCLSIFVANLQPNHWLIDAGQSYPELTSATTGQTLSTAINNAVSSGDVVRVPSIVVSLALGTIAPANMVRFIYLAVLLVTGALSIFFLARDWLRGATRIQSVETGAFAVAIFYVANAFTIQSFFALSMPLLTAYAFLPLMLLCASRYLTNARHHWLILFTLAVVLGLQIGENALLGVAVIALVLLISIKQLQLNKSGLVRLLALMISLILINALWFVPLLSGVQTPQPPTDATISQHLPFALQLVNSGSIGSVTTLAKFQTDWGSHWQSAIMLPLLFLPLALGVITSIWLLILRKGIFRLIAILHLLGIFALMFINIGISIDSLSWPYIAGIKQALALLLMLSTALVLGRFTHWLTSKQLTKLNKSSWLGLAAGGVSLIFYLVLIINPAFQNHLYPATSKLPESFTQLYSYFRTNSTTGNILYLAENLQQDYKSHEFLTNSLPLNKYALPQQLITFNDPATQPAYMNLVHILSSGNQQRITDAWQRYHIDWIVVDQAQLDSNASPVAGSVAGLVSALPDISKVDVIDAGQNEVTFFKVDNHQQSERLASVGGLTISGPAFEAYSIDPSGDITITGQASAGNYYPFRNLSAERMEINDSAKTVRFLSTLSTNNYTSIILPALNKLNLEDVTLQITAASGKLDLSLINAYPATTVNDSLTNKGLVSINLGTTPAPATNYILVLNNQIWGPFSPSGVQTLKLDKLNLTADQNLRIYELYDKNDVTAQFQQQQARNCITYDLIPGSETKAQANSITITSPEDICFTADLPLIETDGSVLTRTTFNYSSNVSLKQCMFSKLGSDCINRNLPDTSISDGTVHQQQVIEELGKVGIRDLQTKFFIARNNSQSTRSVTISDINIEEYKLVTSQTLSLPATTTAQTIGIQNASSVQVTLPFNTAQHSDFNSGAFVDSFKNCAGETEKLELVPQQNQHALQVTATGKLCLQKDYTGLRSGRGHFLVTDYKLTTGDNVNLCIWDINHNLCVQNAVLSGSDIRQSLIVPIPRHGSTATDYRLNFTSEGRLQSSFIISNLELVEADTDAIQQIYLSATLPEVPVIKPIETGAAGGFHVDIDDNSGSQAVLFSQPFGTNDWKLLRLSNPNSTDPLSVAGGFGTALPVTPANGWQQSWQVETGSYYLVNVNTVVVTLLLIVQGIVLFGLLILPTAKEVLMKAVIKGDKD